MRRDCIGCGQSIIVAWTGHHRVEVDAVPVSDGQAVLTGDLDDRPTIWFGDAATDAAGASLDAARYDRHECPDG